MGSTPTKALIAAIVLVIAVRGVAAEPCTGITGSGSRFAICFDLGNRLSVTAASNGFGGALALRHVFRFADDPDLVWKLEHTLFDSTHAAFENRFAGALYRGRFMRHTRDGHIVLPFGTPTPIHLPFDIGGEVEVGSLHWRPGDPIARLGLVKTAALIDLSRSSDFSRRLAIGPVGRWEVALDRSSMTPGLAVAEHIVVPFTAAELSAHAESANGLNLVDLRIEAGTAWHTGSGWKHELSGEATIERIVLAVNDRPIALMLGVSYASATDETIGRIGARIVLFHRHDPRVSLDSLASRYVPSRTR